MTSSSESIVSSILAYTWNFTSSSGKSHLLLSNAFSGLTVSEKCVGARGWGSLQHSLSPLAAGCVGQFTAGKGIEIWGRGGRMWEGGGKEGRGKRERGQESGAFHLLVDSLETGISLSLHSVWNYHSVSLPLFYCRWINQAHNFLAYWWGTWQRSSYTEVDRW